MITNWNLKAQSCSWMIDLLKNYKTDMVTDLVHVTCSNVTSESMVPFTCPPT